MNTLTTNPLLRNLSPLRSTLNTYIWAIFWAVSQSRWVGESYMQAFGADSVKLSINTAACLMKHNIGYDEAGDIRCYFHKLYHWVHKKRVKSIDLRNVQYALWQTVLSTFSGSLHYQHSPYLPDTISVTTLSLPLSWLLPFPNSSFHGNSHYFPFTLSSICIISLSSKPSFLLSFYSMLLTFPL